MKLNKIIFLIFFTIYSNEKPILSQDYIDTFIFSPTFEGKEANIEYLDIMLNLILNNINLCKDCRIDCIRGKFFCELHQNQINMYEQKKLEYYMKISSKKLNK